MNQNLQIHQKQALLGETRIARNSMLLRRFAPRVGAIGDKEAEYFGRKIQVQDRLETPQVSIFAADCKEKARRTGLLIFESTLMGKSPPGYWR